MLLQPGTTYWILPSTSPGYGFAWLDAMQDDPSYQLLFRWDGGMTLPWTSLEEDGEFRVSATVVPEPSTAALMALGMIGLAASQRRKRV